MIRKNWYWDLDIPFNKIRAILKREDDPRFARIAGALLSRVQDPSQVFGLISPAAFCRRWGAIARQIGSDQWARPKAAFWKATYLRLSRELHERGEKIRLPENISLDEFDRALLGQVRQCRKKALLSQKELASMLGYSQQYISGIEKGREKVSIEFLKKLSGVTKQTLEIFIS